MSKEEELLWDKNEGYLELKEELTTEEKKKKHDNRSRDKKGERESSYAKLKKIYKEEKALMTDAKRIEKFNIRTNFAGMASSGGRPKKYTPIRLKNKIIDYFAMISATHRPPTVSGLMVHLKMNRDQFYHYYTYPEFKDIMEQTKNMMENWNEEALVLAKHNTAGIMFALKNRFGWKDLQSVETTVQIQEDQLIHRIAALAPDLVGFIQGATQYEAIEVENDKTAMLAGEAEGETFDFIAYKKERQNGTAK